VALQLAERGTRLSNGLWVREVRKRSAGGKQTAILSTDYRTDYTRLAASMFARWSQENFFRYMRQHYGLDRLVEYGTDPVFLGKAARLIGTSFPWGTFRMSL
jgi:hypothetical protein